MLTCFYGLQRLLGATFSQEKAKYHPLTRFALMALARKNECPILAFLWQSGFALFPPHSVSKLSLASEIWSPHVLRPFRCLVNTSECSF